MLKKGVTVICEETKRVGVVVTGGSEIGETYAIKSPDGEVFYRTERELHEMRSLTDEERKDYNESLDKLFKPIGVNLFELN